MGRRTRLALTAAILLPSLAGLRAQSTATGQLQKQTVHIYAGRSDCPIPDTTQDYTAGSVTIPINASCNGASITAQVQLQFPSTVPATVGTYGNLTLTPPITTLITATGQWTTPDTNYNGSVDIGDMPGSVLCPEVLYPSNVPGGWRPQPLPSGNTNFSLQRPCTFSYFSADNASQQPYTVTLRSYALIDVMRNDDGGLSLVQMEITTVYTFGAATPTTGDSNQAAPGPSGISPRPASDTVYVAQAPHPGCVCGKDGPLIFEIPITRYVGETTALGRLANPELLKQNQVISGFARLTLPVYDVDTNAPLGPGQQPEVDTITFNGAPVEQTGMYLGGAGSQWRLNEFLIPISLLNFPSQSAQVGQPPDVSLAMNYVQINIDVLNPQHDVWCAGFEWAQLSFDAIAPIILVHGTNATHTTWENPDGTPGPVPTYLHALGIPNHYQTIDIGANSSSDANAAVLCDKLNQMAVWFGASSFHLVAHSKGATDSRRFFNQNYRNPGCSSSEGPAPVPFQILSLTSLDTPSRGTIVSEIAAASAETSAVPGYEKSNDPEAAALMRSSMWAKLGAPKDPARGQQTPDGMRKFNLDNPLKSGIKYYSVAADADLNNDHHVSCAEADPVIDLRLCEYYPASGSGVADPLYQIIGRVIAVIVGLRMNSLGFTYNYVDSVSGAQFQNNDLTSTIQSAHYDGFKPILTTKANHSSIKSGPTMQVVLGALRADFPVGLIPR